MAYLLTFHAGWLLAAFAIGAVTDDGLEPGGGERRDVLRKNLFGD